MPGDTIYAKVGCSKQIEQRLDDQQADGSYGPTDLSGKSALFRAVRVVDGVAFSKTATIPAPATQGLVRVILSPSDFPSNPATSSSAGRYRWAWYVAPGPDGSAPRAYPEDGTNLLEVQEL